MRRIIFIFGVLVLFGTINPNCFASGNAEQDAEFFGAIGGFVGSLIDDAVSSSNSGSSSSSNHSSYGSDEYIISTHTYTRNDGVTKRDNVFSGTGVYMNDPSAVDRKYEGPIPHGTYTMRNIGTTNLGPVTIELTPSGYNEMYGRSGFYIHGGTNSAGCIIINDAEFRRSLDGHTLTVR